MSAYRFKGYTIKNCGYHQPDHCVWWEAVDADGDACFHGHTLREVEFMIMESEFEKKLKEKDAEIERLKSDKASKTNAAMRKALKMFLEDVGRYADDGPVYLWCGMRGETIREARRALGLPCGGGADGHGNGDVGPKRRKGDAKMVAPADGTSVWVVYKAKDGLVAYEEKTWHGSVPFDCGPSMVAIDLYDDHSVEGDTGSNYITPIAWYFTEDEANLYIEKHGKGESNGRK